MQKKLLTNYFINKNNMLASYTQGFFKSYTQPTQNVLVLFCCQVFFISYTQLIQVF